MHAIMNMKTKHNSPAKGQLCLRPAVASRGRWENGCVHRTNPSQWTNRTWSKLVRLCARLCQCSHTTLNEAVGSCCPLLGEGGGMKKGGVTQKT